MPSIRLRGDAEIVERFNVVCPELTPARKYEYLSCLANVSLNCQTSFSAWWRTSPAPGLSRLEQGTVAVAWVEALACLGGLSATALGLMPLALRVARGGNVVEAKTEDEIRLWRWAVAATENLKFLGSYSSLHLMFRGKGAPKGLHEQILMEAKNMEKAGGMSLFGVVGATLRCTLFTGLEMLLGIAGLTALHLKLGMLRKELAVAAEKPVFLNNYGLSPFFAFANQMMGVVDVDSLEKNITLRVLFAGEDAELDYGEKDALCQVNAFIARELVKKHGWFTGWKIFMSLDGTDLQQLVVAQHDGSPTSKALSMAKPRWWWLGGVRQSTALGQVISLAARGRQ